jgi:peptide/nickel transport system ATP-binding protein
MSALDIQGLSISYMARGVAIDAVRDLSLSLAPGERLGLVGESGSGKTTTALAVMGMLRPPGRVTAGHIQLDGTELIGLDPGAHRRLRLSCISYVPQGAMNSLNPVLRVRHSIADAIRAHQPMSGAALHQRITALLAEVGLPPETAERYPHQLSGGMKQRVCIALAISLGPRVIIADEPTSALDVVTQRQVMRTLHEAQERYGSAMLLIGHDMGLMAQSVHRIAVMRHGRLEELGSTRRILRNPTSPYTAELIRSVPMIGGPSAATSPGPSALSPASGPSLLAFEQVSQSFGGGVFGGTVFTALHALSLQLPADRARILAIVGQSGSGKTTLGSLVLGFAAPSTGIVRYGGADVARLRGDARRRFRREVQAVFQDPYSTFNPFYRVSRSLSLPLRTFGLAGNPAQRRAMMEASCRQVGLDPSRLLDRFPHQLSGGQRQRLMVARALMLRPRLLVADEPVSMVDASLRASILDLLVELRDAHGISILYITHDLATAYRVADEVLVLHKGRVVEAGAPGPVLQHPRHPYTRLLVDCLPWPDPDRPWGRIIDEASMSREIDAMQPAPPILRSAPPTGDCTPQDTFPHESGKQHWRA